MVSPMSITESPPHKGLEIGMIAAGFAGCQTTAGVEAGPAAILEIGLLGPLKQDLGLSVHFDNQTHYYSEIIPQVDPPYHKMNRPRTVSAVTQKLSAQIYEHVSKGRRVLTSEAVIRLIGYREDDGSDPGEDWFRKSDSMPFDIDSLDPEWAPSTRLQVPGGLSVQESKYIAERVYQSGRLMGINLVEINPEIEKTQSSQTIRAGLDVLFAALGKIS